MDDNEEHSPSEQSPFLPSNRPVGESQEPSLIPQVHSPHSVVLLICLAIFVLMLGSCLLTTPQLRVYEDIICRHYYDEMKGEVHISLTGNVDESLCKIDEIQEELAILVGGLGVTENIPSLLFALPYGVLGDRIGRKRVFGLALSGIILSQSYNLIVCWFWKMFPLRLIWFSPVFQIIGGGNAVVQSTIYALISDVSTDENRANNFFWIGCGVLAAEFISPSIASSLMLRSPWIPLFLGLGVLTFGGVFMIFVPETLRHKTVDGSIESVLELSDSGFSSSTMLRAKYSVLSKLKKNFDSMCDTLRVYASVPLLLLLATFLIQFFNRQLIELVLRYISKRFKWTLAQTGFLLSLRALINIALFLAILPGISYLLTSKKFNLSTTSKDLILARVSLIIQLLGAFFLALSAFPSPNGESNETAVPITLAIGGLVTYTLGLGFQAFCRSLITTLVDQQHVARLYAIISVIDTLGTSIAAPGLAWLYSWGMRLSRKGAANGYLGLPFWGAMIFTTIAGGGIMWVKVPERKLESLDENESRIMETEVQAEFLM